MKIFISLSSAKDTTALQKKLTSFGILTDGVHDEDMMYFLLKTSAYDVVMVSWHNKRSTEILSTIRTICPRTPIIVCLDSPLVRFAPGNDLLCDVIRKPYRLQELMQKILSLMRTEGNTRGVLQCKDIIVDLNTKQVMRRGSMIPLAKKEFQLLEFLIRNKNKVVTRAEIHDFVWERDMDPMTNAIDVHISRLRKKLGMPNFIGTAYGFGYVVKD